MSRHIVIDPVTRIEGHLRLDVEVDGGRVRDAWSSGQMWRGIERILEGRDPREAWLFTQRICGVCTTVHAIASVRAVEDALDLVVPVNAQYIRNLMLVAHALHDHIVHFYHLTALDWVDVVAALDADPAAAARLGEDLSAWGRNGRRELEAVQAKVRRMVASGQLGIFANGYWGHRAMELPPEVDLLAVAHYLQALEYQRKANQAVAVLGGKTPNVQNLAVGGVANAINLDSQDTFNMRKLYQVRDLLDEVTEFIEQVYLPDVVAIAAMYPGWFGHGAGVLDYLALPDLPLDAEASRFDLPGGTIFGGDLASCRPIESFRDPSFRDGVAESIARSWYRGDWTRHPWDEETEPAWAELDRDGAYSWVKAPRFEGRAMQVGPLAQVLVGYATGHEAITRRLDDALARASALAGRPLTPDDLHSTMGRHLARAVRAAVLAELGREHWRRLAENIAGGDVESWVEPRFPAGEVRGVGLHEAPRGALSHWVVIRDGKIANYQAVVPSTWNAGPRDGRGRRGPYEASLLGNPVADPERPLEVLRTVHSFDPCLACAIHAVDPAGRELAHLRTH